MWNDEQKSVDLEIEPRMNNVLDVGNLRSLSLSLCKKKKERVLILKKQGMAFPSSRKLSSSYISK